MLPIEIKPGIYWIGVNDRATELFEGLWPVHREGVSLNSYFINDEKKVIVDLTHEVTTSNMLAQLNQFTSLADVDYFVINHMEPDHTGALVTLRQIAPNAVILCSERAQKMLADFYGITDGIRTVKDGETLPLGRYTLQFFSTPNVHWPETMMTFVQEAGVLFSCDGFGGFRALEGSIFDDEITDLAGYESEALRYYTNIVSGFSKPVLNAIQKLQGLPISVVAPSHGIVWRSDPLRIVSLYRQWASYAGQLGEPGITMVFGTMYGDTDRMSEAIIHGIRSEGVPFNVFDVSRTHVSYILPSLWTQAGVLVGAPTYEGRMFPPVAHVLEMAMIKRIRNKLAGCFGSYGWGGGAMKTFEQMLPELQWELKGAMNFLGVPNREKLRAGEAFGASFARSVKETTVTGAWGAAPDPSHLSKN
ncbi:MAG TPA: FprA family A-type flavoprotein [Anaerolineaceae bacterium]|nr:FprA family A-type flavoprotein [Anaerolineaceae bacterium]